MAGLSKKQLDQLKGAENVDQDLVSSYKKSPEPETPQSGGSDDLDQLQKFDLVANEAKDLAREKRQDSVLDMMGGIVPKGALPASSFASVLNAFNSSAAPVEASLIKSGTDRLLQIEDEKKNNQNSIRELALNVATETGDTKAAKVIAALAESGDIDAAITASLAAYGDEYSRNEAGSIIKTDKDKNETVVFDGSGYDASTQTVEGKSMGKLFEGRDDSLTEIPYKDYTNNRAVTLDDVQTDTRKYLPTIAASVKESLTSSQERQFLVDYIEMTTQTQQYQDPKEYFERWMRTNILDITWVTEEESKESEEEEEKETFSNWATDQWEPEDPNK